MYQKNSSWISSSWNNESNGNAASQVLQAIPPILPNCEHKTVVKWFEEYRRYEQLVAAKGLGHEPVPMTRCISVEALDYMVGRHHGINSHTQLSEQQKWDFVEHIYNHNGVDWNNVRPADVWKGLFMKLPRVAADGEKCMTQYLARVTQRVKTLNVGECLEAEEESMWHIY